MAGKICSTCQRCNGDVEPRFGASRSRDISLASLDASAASCEICGFVHNLLEQDMTTPNIGDSLYQSSMVRVDEDGLRFTGQWQGALVIEVYKTGMYLSRVDARASASDYLQAASRNFPDLNSFPRCYAVPLQPTSSMSGWISVKITTNAELTAFLEIPSII